ncbi:MAG: extracellular solute-binding protein [Lachnospiraceae bacterium]|nr:extracellular solute-binding protein [Lachnospiraceae bacterium]
MKKKIYMVLSALLMTAMICSGCGTEKEKTGTDVGAGEQTEAGGPITLRVWAGEEDHEMLTKVADAFVAENSGTDITIEIEAMMEGECRSNLLGDVLNGPDVYTTTDGDLQSIVAGGAASPVVNADEIKKNNIEAANEAMTIKDTMYGYPLTADNGYFLYYNKKYFSDSDLQTLDQILKVCEENGKKFAMDWSSGWYLYSFFGQTGLSVGLNPDGVTNFCDWNSTDNAIKGVDVANALLSISGSDAFLATSDCIGAAAAGDAIAFVSGVWDESAVKTAWGRNYGACKLPTYTVNGSQVQMSCYFGYKMVGVNPYSKHLEWAHKFAEYMTNEENQILRFKMRGQGPSNINAGQSAEIKEALAIQAVIAQSEFSELQRLGGNYWGASTTLGNTLAAGNPDHIDLQELMDTMVEQATASTVQ